MDAFKRRKELQTCILLKPPNDYWQEIRAVHAMHEVVLANKVKYGDGAPHIVDDTKLISEPLMPSESDDDEPMVVGLDAIAAVASLWSGIPIQQLTADERRLLVALDEQLRKRVVGQDEAVVAISRAMKRSRVGLKDPDRPIATMLFCGPTGVGKIELAKALVACYFGSVSPFRKSQGHLDPFSFIVSFKDLAGSQPLSELQTAEEVATLEAANSEASGQGNEGEVVSAGLSEAEELENYVTIREKLYKKLKNSILRSLVLKQLLRGLTSMCGSSMLQSLKIGLIILIFLKEEMTLIS